MIKSLFRLLTHPFFRLLKLPTFRYSGPFIALQDAFLYVPYENLIKTAMEFVAYSDLKGEYLEFGVFKGTHLISAYHFAKQNRLDAMRFYAFDSFEGLPEIRGVDMSAPRQFSKGEFACDVQAFKNNIVRNGVDLNRVTTIEGWFEQSLTEETKRDLSIQRAAIVWIDCDFYESTVPVLDFISDYIQDGTVLIFDDWFCFNGNPELGQRRAFREWLDRNPSITVTEWYKYGWTGNSFILHRKLELLDDSSTT